MATVRRRNREHILRMRSMVTDLFAGVRVR